MKNWKNLSNLWNALTPTPSFIPWLSWFANVTSYLKKEKKKKKPQTSYRDWTPRMNKKSPILCPEICVCKSCTNKTNYQFLLRGVWRIEKKVAQTTGSPLLFTHLPARNKEHRTKKKKRKEKTRKKRNKSELETESLFSISVSKGKPDRRKIKRWKARTSLGWFSLPKVNILVR